MNIREIIPYLFIIILLVSCNAEGNYPGREYMPDMGHSVAYETYTTSPNTSDTAAVLLPIKGTVPRGYMPYPLTDTEEDRLRSVELIKNPYKMTAKDLSEGKRLYNNQCAICHGAKGAGQGTIVTNGKYPAVPPSYFEERVLKLGEGGIYHAIMYGKNLMGSYAPQLEPKERWQVVEYIRSLQEKEVGLETMYSSIGQEVPVKVEDVVEEVKEIIEEVVEEETTHKEGAQDHSEGSNH